MFLLFTQIWFKIVWLCIFILVHFFQLLSSNMEQKGEDHEGILGFLPDDIGKEIKRGRRLVNFQNTLSLNIWYGCNCYHFFCSIAHFAKKMARLWDAVILNVKKFFTFPAAWNMIHYTNFMENLGIIFRT